MAKKKRTDKNISARLDSDLVDEIMRIAAREDLTVTQIVRRAIREYVKKDLARGNDASTQGRSEILRSDGENQIQ